MAPSDPTANGYLLLTAVPTPETADDWDGEPEDPDVLAGKAYRFHLKFEGAYTQLSTHIMSSTGVACDQTAPAVTLATSSDFFTANGTLTLTAAATDDVAVSKVVFAQDGVAIGTDDGGPVHGRCARDECAQRPPPLHGHRVRPHRESGLGDQARTGRHRQQVLRYGGDRRRPTTRACWRTSTRSRPATPASGARSRRRSRPDELDRARHRLRLRQDQPHPLQDPHAGLGPAAAGLDRRRSPPTEQLAEIEEWMAAVAARYPDDRAHRRRQRAACTPPPSYAAALGGAGATGWDWVVNAFEMARTLLPERRAPPERLRHPVDGAAPRRTT